MDVRGPDGKIVRFPDGTPPSTIHAVMTSRYGTAEQRLGLGPTPKADFGDVAGHAMTFGLSDEAAGIGDALVNAIRAPFSSKVDFHPIDAYNSGKAARLKALADYARANPVSNVAANIVGAAASAPKGVAELVARAPTLVGRIVQGAKAAIPWGAAQGFGNSEGLAGRAKGAGLGALAAASLGGALPVAGAAFAPMARGVASLAAKPGTRAARMIAQAMSADKLTPAQVGANMDAVRNLGVPAMLADQGENLRRLGGSVTRQPGPARTMMTDALTQRMAGQNDRIINAVDKHLGPTANVADASDALIAQAKTAAAPLYAKAHAAPGVASDTIDGLLNTPAGKAALGHARTIALNDQVDPNRIGIDLNAQGEPVLTKVPTMQTLDYVKQALDGMVEDFRDPITRQLNLNPAGRAINGVRGRLLTEMDRLNPDYATARAAYAGPAQEREALWQGQKMVGQPAQQIDRATLGMSDSQRAQFELGYRSKMAGNVNKMVDAADRPRALTGSPERRAALQQTFGQQPGLPNFLDTLSHEAAGNATYRVGMTGSPTAVNLADDQMTSGANVLGPLFHAAADLKTGGLYGAIRGAAAAAPRALDRARSGDDVRQGIAAFLSETDANAFRRHLQDLDALNARDTITRNAASNRRIGTGQVTGSLLGYLLAQPVPQPPQ
jgi:hypothetical protein